MDESGCPVPDWIGFIRAARNSQEQNLEAVSDLPGGQVNIHPLTLSGTILESLTVTFPTIPGGYCILTLRSLLLSSFFSGIF